MNTPNTAEDFAKKMAEEASSALQEWEKRYNAQPKRVVTHSGPFHCDELLAYECAKHFLGTGIPDTFPELERLTRSEWKKQGNALLSDPDVLVLDIGGEYAPEKGNFDHHQDGQLPATNMLVLLHVCKDVQLVQLLQEHLFTCVSDHDTGKIAPPASLPTLVSACNNLGIGYAQDLVSTAFAAVLSSSLKSIVGRQRWDALEKNGRVAIDHNKTPIVGWKQLAKRDGVLALIRPNSQQEGCWSVTSVSTDVLVLPQDDRQTFRHASGFTCCFNRQTSLEEVKAWARQQF